MPIYSQEQLWIHCIRLCLLVSELLQFNFKLILGTVTARKKLWKIPQGCNMNYRGSCGEIKGLEV